MTNKSSFKTYKSVDRSHDQVHFSVTRMEEIFKKHKGEPDEPHRHEFYTLMIVQEAVGKTFCRF
jgi:AraC family transcriptional regulator, transcriptional activator of pobA